MGAAFLPTRPVLSGNPFDLDDDIAYQRWRTWKLSVAATRTDDLIVDLADPRALTPAEREALLDRIARTNMAIYRSPMQEADPELPRRLGAQLGLVRLDTNWLAEEDGISHIRRVGAERRPRRLHPLHRPRDPLAHRWLLPPGRAPHPRDDPALCAPGARRWRQRLAGPRAGLHRAARRRRRRTSER
jgi:hypothetical protein